MRILIRTSKWAIWARRTGALALPLAAIAVLLHRIPAITSENFMVVAAVALALAALAVLMALVAYARLWFSGDQGWWKATLGFVFGLIVLTPAAWLGWAYTQFPGAADVSTDFANSPPLVSFVEQRFVGPDERARVEAAFPNARSRNYPITAAQMFDVVAGMLDDRGWDIRSRRQPQGPLDDGQLNAVVTTLLGFRQEVVIRVSGSADGATVAMRSTSLSDFPDFGENGQRVEAFLLDLDNQVTLMLRDAPAAPASDDDAG